MMAAQVPADALVFLACLTQVIPADALTFQTFTDTKPKPVPDPLAFVRSGALQKHHDELMRLSGRGAGIFIAVNQTDLQGRKKENIVALRGWWADLDTKDASEALDLARLPLAPTMVVRTPGGWHLYWLALDPMPCGDELRRDEHEAELKTIAQSLKAFGGDAGACDVGRVLRVPGYLHKKEEPRLVELVSVNGPRYTREQIREAFPLMEKPKAEVRPAAKASRGAVEPARADVMARGRAYLATCPAAIQGSDGSGALFDAALKVITRFNLTESEALDLLSGDYNARCEPSWSDAELAHKVADAHKVAQQSPDLGCALSAGPSRGGEIQTPSPGVEGPVISSDPAIEEDHSPSQESGKASQATKALRMAIEAGAEAWMDEAGTPHLTVLSGEHVEHHRLKSDPDSPAARWLARIFYKKEGRALASSAKKDALENLIAEATATDRIFPTARRVFRQGGTVFLDLCSPTWEVVEVSGAGWAIRQASEVPIRFTRAQAMQAIPVPTRGGRVSDLKPFFHCDEDDFRLVVAWTLAALSGGREYPVLSFGGEPGSAKSTATRYARALVDPNAAPLRKTPKEERDLFIAAGNAFVLTFDNLSSPPEWLPDALCALALGTGYAIRSLYTDSEETVFRVASPCIVNGISEQLTRSDLADRALSVTLHRIDQTEMKPKDELDAAFSAVLPAVLGAFLDVLASALANLPNIQLDRLPRLAQTAKLMAAAEPALGWEAGTFMRLFDRAQESVAANMGESDPLALALQELVARHAGRWTFRGTATELRIFLDTVRPSPMPQVWPPAANKVSERLRRIAVPLRLMGWAVNLDGRTGGKQNRRFVELTYPAPPSLSFSIFEEKEGSLSSSDRPGLSNGAGIVSDDPLKSIVTYRPNSSGVADGQPERTIDPERRTIAEQGSSDRRPAPPLDPGRSDDSNGQTGDSLTDTTLAALFAGLPLEDAQALRDEREGIREY